MDVQLAILCILTFVIHRIGTLAYAVRIAGVRTRRIAVSFALFNTLVFVSLTSNVDAVYRHHVKAYTHNSFNNQFPPG